MDHENQGFWQVQTKKDHLRSNQEYESANWRGVAEPFPEQNGDPDREPISPYPKNDYAPPFVSSLNFNFNMNDVFGSTKK